MTTVQFTCDERYDIPARDATHLKAILEFLAASGSVGNFSGPPEVKGLLISLKRTTTYTGRTP